MRSGSLADFRSKTAAIEKKHPPVLKFRILLSQASRLYFTVRVFAKLRDMRRLHAAEVGATAKYYHRALGACSFWDCTPPVKGKESNEVGIISLWKDRVGVEVVSHECTHAALAGLSRRGCKSIETRTIGGDRQEELCYMVGWMVNQIYREIYAANLADPRPQPVSLAQAS